MGRLKKLSSISMLLNTRVIVLAAFSISLPVYADLQGQVHGFLTQGYVKTERYDFFGESKGIGSTEYREVGITGSLKPYRRLHTSAQVIYRVAGSADPASVDIDFAVLDYQFLTGNDYNSGLRLGRIKNPMGLYNDTRDVAFTRPGVILPQSIYFDRVRDFSLSSDGAQYYGYYSSRWADLNVQLLAAYPRMSTNTEVSLFSSDLPGHLEENLSYLGRITLELYSGLIKLVYSEIYLDVDYAATPAEGLSSPGFLFRPRIFSLQINLEDVILTAEYARRSFKFTEMPVPFADFTGESYYLQAEWIVTQKIRLYARLDQTYSNMDDRDGEKFSALTGGTRPAHSQFARDYVTGIQHRINSAWLLMLEQHIVRGTAWLPVQDNTSVSSTESEWWMFSALVCYRF